MPSFRRAREGQRERKSQRAREEKGWRKREEGESEIERERERGSESEIERGMEKSQRVREKEKGVWGIVQKRKGFLRAREKERWRRVRE